MHRLYLFLAALFLVSAAQTTPTPPPAATATLLPIEYLTVDVLAEYPHDTGAYTQGLLWHDGTLYESVGQDGESDLRQVELETGAALRLRDNDPLDFAEGLALVDDRLIQLTWYQGVAYIYDRDSFDPLGTFSYEGQGWGLCYDGTVLWMSDGSEILTARDPETFEIIRQQPITYAGYPLSQIEVTASRRRLDDLNELECAEGYVYANVWYTDYILRIDPATGQVTGVIDASTLLTPEEREAILAIDPDSVLNGIAYDPETDTFFLTGKYWPTLFAVQFRPQTGEG